jgi:acid phosphatase family membrane protein YuiD
MNTLLFLLPLLVGLLAQFSKRFFNSNWHAEMTEIDSHLPHYGGMPSAHTAFAFSLLTVIAYAEGFSSASFAIAVVLAVIILDDALRMRIFLGRHGEALHRLISKLPKQEQQEYPLLETQLGHRPIEALAGAIVGVLLTVIILFLIP